jgi:hypothetical protein
VWSLCELIGQAKLSEVEGVTLTGGDKEGAPRRGCTQRKIGEKKDEKEKKGSPIERAGKQDDLGLSLFPFATMVRSVQVGSYIDIVP